MGQLQRYFLEEGYTEENKREDLELMKKWDDRCLQEEIIWKKKYRILWLQEGEKNTKFFHRSARTKSNSNRTLKIKDAEGKYYESHKYIEYILV